MSEKTATIAFSLPRTAAVMAATVVTAGAIACGVCVALGAFEQIIALGMTAVACLLVSVAALVPVQWRVSASQSGLAEGFAIGILMRMALTGLAVVVIHAVTGIAAMSLGLWAGGWYLLLLVIEVLVLVSLAGKVGRA